MRRDPKSNQRIAAEDFQTRAPLSGSVDLPTLTSKQALAPMTIGPPPYSVSGIGYIKVQQNLRKINTTNSALSLLAPDSIPLQDVARNHDLLNFVCPLEDRIYSCVAIEPFDGQFS